MVSINNITVSFGGWNLFSEISFDITPKDRIGLVGRNGAGKSTLMKLICGENKPSEGTISMSSDTIVGYLAQQMSMVDDSTVIDETLKAFANLHQQKSLLEELSGELSKREDYQSDDYMRLIERFNHVNDHYNLIASDNPLAQCEKTLIGLGFRRDDFQRKTSEFSGGWRMRIELAKILLQKPDILLLDEPTNHLDIESICWLENYLAQYRGSVVLISHDRRFLDTVTNRTVEIMLGKLYDYKVAYSKYESLRQERMQQQQAAYDNQQKSIKQTEDFIERFRYKASKSNQVQSRVKMLEKMDIIEIDEYDNSRLNIKFPPAPHSGEIVLEVKGLGKKFDDSTIFEGFDMVLQRGQKIALVGRNGEGKTTFARMIVGDTPITFGSIKHGQGVDIGYYAQNQDDLMDGEFTVLDTLDRVAVGDIRTRLRDILAAFLFKGEDIDKRVKVLSGGERSRLAMARMMLTSHNLLILDEPTNHMDMRSKEILKSAIDSFDGTVIVVSHDREFLEGIIDKVYEFRDGSVKEHLGGINDFLATRQIEILDQLNIASKNQTQKEEQTSQNKLSYLQKKEADKVIRKLKNQISELEKQMEQIEAKELELSKMIADPQGYGIDLSDPKYFEQYSQLKKDLEQKMEKWTDLSQEVEDLENE